MDQLLEPSKRNCKSLSQHNDLSKNCVNITTLNPPNLTLNSLFYQKWGVLKLLFSIVVVLPAILTNCAFSWKIKQFTYLDWIKQDLDKTSPDSQVDIGGYDILRRYRNRSGWGVAFYIAQSSTYINRQDLLSHEDLEILTVETQVQAILGDNLV